MKDVLFLGGMIDPNYLWRKDYVELIKNIEVFDPWVEDWTEEFQKIENEYRANSDYVLFTIAGNNLYSIAELTECSIKKPESTIMVLDLDYIENVLKFELPQIKSFKAIAKLVESNGATVFYNHQDAIEYLQTK